MTFFIILPLFLTFFHTDAFPNKRPPRNDNKYEDFRRDWLLSEEGTYLGHELTLTPDEIKLEDILMRHKIAEIQEGFGSPGNFTGARHFFDVFERIGKSKVFELIKKMPKGGVLHAHDTALLSTGRLMQFMNQSHLWMCDGASGIRFWVAPTKNDIKIPCEAAKNGWEDVSELRKKNLKDFETKVRKALTLHTNTPDAEYRDIQEVWKKFIDKFTTIEGLVGYIEIWKEYFKQSLEEFYADGVQYLEFRGLLPPVYDFNGKFLTKTHIVRAYTDVLQEFMTTHPDFIGAKFIYAPLRLVNRSTVDEYRQTFTEIKKEYPAFVTGFDLVGPEETEFPLSTFKTQLQKFPPETNFFFHAGETNWNGLDTDENLIDAVLLGTRRIGHGYALVKHPRVMEEVKKRDIAVEVCPISNQVLKLVADHRNHPASVLFANNVPVVVSSDDPSLWNSSPLSHDFYIAFMGIASARAGLKFLKKLAMNSLTYASLNEQETTRARMMWEKKWNEFVSNVVKNEK